MLFLPSNLVSSGLALEELKFTTYLCLCGAQETVPSSGRLYTIARTLAGVMERDWRCIQQRAESIGRLQRRLDR